METGRVWAGPGPGRGGEGERAAARRARCRRLRSPLEPGGVAGGTGGALPAGGATGRGCDGGTAALASPRVRSPRLLLKPEDSGGSSPKGWGVYLSPPGEVGAKGAAGGAACTSPDIAGGSACGEHRASSGLGVLGEAKSNALLCHYWGGGKVGFCSWRLGFPVASPLGGDGAGSR